MLKGNLATRPFYNERGVNVLLVIAAVAGLGLTAFNTTRIMTYSDERGQRAAAADTFTEEADRIQSATERQRQAVDQTTLAALGADTFEANQLIGQRLFSWTVFFGLVEKTLPLDTRLVAVAPRLDRNELFMDMIVNAKRPDDLAAFIEALQGTGAFYDVLATEQQRNDDGTYDATLTGGYLAPSAAEKRTTGAAGGAKQP